MSAPVQFSSKLTTVLVAAGCSVGLGNIWRFPYVAGEGGGGAFLLVYLACILFIGLPIMLSEFVIGRETNKSAVGALKKLTGHKWSWLGYNGVLAITLIMGFYYVVAGWTAEYFLISVTGELENHVTPESYSALFGGFVTDPWKPVAMSWLFIAVNHIIVVQGVTKGLEKVAKYLMPLLFLILIILCVNSLMMNNAINGVEFFLKPDFSKITGKVVLQAAGQAFFSLSVGIGALIAYGSYVPKEASLRNTVFQVSILDTLVAILAGLIIFPAAFSVGIDPGSGPALVFETLPAIFQTLPMASLWASIFFLLLIIAALTTTMSFHEVVTVFFMEEVGFSRRMGVYCASAIAIVLSGIASLSLGDWSEYTIFGMTIFDFMDYITSNFMMTLGGMFTCIYIGWYLDKSILTNQVTNFGELKCSYLPFIFFLLKYVCPIVIFIIFLNGIGLIG
ncbi:MAG: sodium-dependent transporter [Rikenellaceae bacterium]